MSKKHIHASIETLKDGWKCEIDRLEAPMSTTRRSIILSQSIHNRFHSRHRPTQGSTSPLTATFPYNVQHFNVSELASATPFVASRIWHRRHVKELYLWHTASALASDWVIGQMHQRNLYLNYLANHNVMDPCHFRFPRVWIRVEKSSSSEDVGSERSMKKACT